MPPRCAASSFSFRPPIGRTSPRSVISPVIATSARTGMPVSAETNAVAIADARARAVLGRRAVGHVDVDVALLEDLVLDAEAPRAAAHHRARRLDRFLHHVAELAGADDVALAGHHRRLDRQQLAADLGPRQAGDLADLVLLLGLAVAELAHAQVVVRGSRSVDRRPCRSTFFSSSALTTLRQILAISRSSVRTPASRV